jgi:aminodeoxyfutalosine deaminase
MRPVPTADPALREALRRLPKTELHLHALGALRPQTVVDLARAKNARILPLAERGAAEGYVFRDLTRFVQFFIGLFELVRTRDDFARVTFEILEDAALNGVRYAELRWTPTSHISRGATEEDMFLGIEVGRLQAERTHGIVSRILVDFPRSLPVAVAQQAVEIAVRQRERGVTALDISGDERAVAADPVFAPIFTEASRAGLHSTAHAGEAAGPLSIRGALDFYGAERIGHGTRLYEDDDLLDRVVFEGIPLEVCPTSNAVLRVVRSVAEHPVVDYLAKGVRCVVSSDDPSLFGTDIVREYERLHLEAGIPLSTLGLMAALGFEHAFAEDGPRGRETRARLAAMQGESLSWEPGVPDRTAAGAAAPEAPPTVG